MSMWRRLQPHALGLPTPCAQAVTPMSMRPAYHPICHLPCLPQVCTQVAGAASRSSEPLAEPLAELRGPGAAAGSSCRLGSATAPRPGLLRWTHQAPGCAPRSRGAPLAPSGASSSLR